MRTATTRAHGYFAGEDGWRVIDGRGIAARPVETGDKPRTGGLDSDALSLRCAASIYILPVSLFERRFRHRARVVAKGLDHHTIRPACRPG